jgi:hypothetical protein
MKKIHLAFFVVGSSIKFRKDKTLRSDGSSEYYALAKLLIKNPAVGRITLIGKSDWHRITQEERNDFDPEGKIFNPYHEFPELNARKKPPTTEEKPEYYKQFYETLEANGLKPDFGLGFISQGWTTLGLPGFLNTLRPPHRRADALDMTLYYASDALYYLNMSNLKWWMYATDPRYVKPSMRQRDVSNFPQSILGQQDFEVNWFGLKEFDREASLEKDSYFIKKIQSRYSGIEKMNLIGDGIIDPASREKPHKFTIVSMQLTSDASTKDDLRFTILKEYILNRDPEGVARIFGKWSERYKAGYPQFKGYIATEDLDETFADTRYTLVLPTAAGWVTSKYAEMLQLAVVPFFHPKYDTQHHVVPADHFIRVKNADDFYKKMEFLDKHPDERIALVRRLQEQLISTAYTGQFMLDLLNDTLKSSDMDFSFDVSEESLYPRTEKIITKAVKEEAADLSSFFV